MYSRRGILLRYRDPGVAGRHTAGSDDGVACCRVEKQFISVVDVGNGGMSIGGERSTIGDRRAAADRVSGGGHLADRQTVGVNRARPTDSWRLGWRRHATDWAALPIKPIIILTHSLSATDKSSSTRHYFTLTSYNSVQTLSGLSRHWRYTVISIFCTYGCWTDRI